jgi:hypothetical protein
MAADCAESERLALLKRIEMLETDLGTAAFQLEHDRKQHAEAVSELKSIIDGLKGNVGAYADWAANRDVHIMLDDVHAPICGTTAAQRISALAAQRDAAIEQRDAAIAQRDATKTSLDLVVAQRDDARATIDASIKQFQDINKELDRMDVEVRANTLLRIQSMNIMFHYMSSRINELTRDQSESLSALKRFSSAARDVASLVEKYT